MEFCQFFCHSFPVGELGILQEGFCGSVPTSILACSGLPSCLVMLLVSLVLSSDRFIIVWSIVELFYVFQVDLVLLSHSQFPVIFHSGLEGVMHKNEDTSSSLPLVGLGQGA